MIRVRWNIFVSIDTDQSLGIFLASQGGDRQVDLSRFIEGAVRAHILKLTAQQVKAANAGFSEPALSAMTNEAVESPRSH